MAAVNNKRRKPNSKYGAQKVHTDHGTYDSKHEYKRYLQLRQLEQDGQIYDLQRQVRYVLIPSQRDSTGKCIERPCAYVADFVYSLPDGQQIVEDAKGVRTPEYVVKRKLMLYLRGIRIHEV